VVGGGGGARQRKLYQAPGCNAVVIFRGLGFGAVRALIPDKIIPEPSITPKPDALCAGFGYAVAIDRIDANCDIGMIVPGCRSRGA
jgi:hypothetical protein